MSRFAVMTMTSAAAERIKSIVDASESAADGIRVGIKKGGCAGMEYTVDLADAPRTSEDVVERDGARVFVAPEAVLFLLGTEMDYETTVLRSGFVFRNPNQTSACGCGESVELKQADLAAMAAAQGA
ncbi:Fe-S cluster assembly scaffold SufA [Jiella sonneratiae]|uniref:Fe-S cluster assembly scaffold SufA n=1 Tax=Jiella sonneratiae TaxID=2816856 RepID=A0ABS3IXD3_9HYPH|nr:Fe-S cluster assembly scaffold SufA [Jiella sonneratiae]MBO0902049.1 Fe-S cluster assembly scaffold SufA [Jiella sonneratiae]